MKTKPMVKFTVPLPPKTLRQLKPLAADLYMGVRELSRYVLVDYAARRTRTYYNK